MIKMQYPNIKGNSLCDGKTHIITPHRISRIEDFDIFLMEYYDETMGCQCSTILLRTSNGELIKIPLLDYNLLFNMIKNGELRLTPEDLSIFFIKGNYIKTREPVKDFRQCLAQARAAIILYIDENGNIYYKDSNSFGIIDGNTLSRLMQAYDIEWHRKETNALASNSEIDNAIHKTMGHMLKHDRYADGLSYEERYKIGNIHHYTIGYQYTDDKGFKRGSSSI